MLPAMSGIGLGPPDQSRCFLRNFAGAYGYPKKAAVETPVKTAENYVKNHPDAFKKPIKKAMRFYEKPLNGD
jgi:hypothetical protein